MKPRSRQVPMGETIRGLGIYPAICVPAGPELHGVRRGRQCRPGSASPVPQCWLQAVRPGSQGQHPGAVEVKACA